MSLFSKPWSTACPDWEERILACRPLVPDLPLIKGEAERALRIFRRLKLPDVEGTPTMAEACDEWFLAFVAAIFGSYDPALRRRMVSEFFELIPKGNAKSSNGGAVMVTAMIMNRRPRGEFLLVAPTKEIADIAFSQAEGTIAIDAELSKLFHLQRHVKTITNQRSGATLKIKASDTDVITGSKACGTLIDETHVFAQRSDAAKIFTELRGALAKRPDGFLIQTTTQSKEPPAGVFKEELQLARAVRDGKVVYPLLPLLYELPQALSANDGWKERRTWRCVNPNLGRSVDEQFLADQLIKAEQSGRAALALLASQHFNVEVGLALRNDRWAGAEFWRARADPALTREALLKRCEVIVVGLDGGGLDDLYGLAMLGREAAETEIDTEETDSDGALVPAKKRVRRWLSWSHAWCHEGVLERRKTIAPALEDFARDGDLTIVDDELGDISGIVAIVEEVKNAGLLACVSADPAGLGEMVDALAQIDVVQDNRDSGRNYIIGAPQGYAMMNALKTSERKLANGTLLHADQPLMDWSVGNVKIEPTATAIRATKQNAGDAKVDPVFALFDAVTVMATNPGSARSVYEERGLLVL